MPGISQFLTVILVVGGNFVWYNNYIKCSSFRHSVAVGIVWRLRGVPKQEISRCREEFYQELAFGGCFCAIPAFLKKWTIEGKAGIMLRKSVGLPLSVCIISSWRHCKCDLNLEAAFRYRGMSNRP